MNFRLKPIVMACTVTLGLSACVSRPVGPSVAVMPAPGKPFDLFKQEDAECRAYAQSAVGTTADDAAAKSVAQTAAVGAAVGALAGAISGGHGSAGTGAAVGMVGGSLVGSDVANRSSYEVQRRYDIAYQQCMYSKGNQVPGYSGARAAPYSQQRPAAPPPPPPTSVTPPPPPPPVR